MELVRMVDRYLYAAKRAGPGVVRARTGGSRSAAAPADPLNQVIGS